MAPSDDADRRPVLALVPLAPQLRREPLPRPNLTLSRLASPVGEVLAVADHAGSLRALDFGDFEARLVRLLQRHYGPFELHAGAATAPHRCAIDGYFAGEPDAFAGLRMAAAGSTFQHRVWTALLDIPHGATASYAWLAERIGSPAAVRAVGLANGANPIAIAVPCHRVVGAFGSLTGYGGGLPRKDWLLRHEGAEPGRRPNLSARGVR